jgi:hypothetical protein
MFLLSTFWLAHLVYPAGQDTPHSDPALRSSEFTQVLLLLLAYPVMILYKEFED